LAARCQALQALRWERQNKRSVTLAGQVYANALTEQEKSPADAGPQRLQVNGHISIIPLPQK
jgi:hypothetical protein